MNRRAVLEGIRRAFCAQAGVSEREVDFCFYSSRSDQFLLKDTRGMFWGKIFHDTAPEENSGGLLAEHEKLQGALGAEMLPVFFIPRMQPADGTVSRFSIPAGTVFFHYTLLRAGGGPLVKLSGRRVKVPGSQKTDEKTVDTMLGEIQPAEGGDRQFFKRGILSREELLELLELSLDLVRIGSVE
jgi:hypothetical protein